EQLGRRADAVEVFADHRAVEETGAVIEDEGRHLGQRVELQELGIGGADLHPLDLLVEAALDGAGRDLADVGAGGRKGELHSGVSVVTTVILHREELNLQTRWLGARPSRAARVLSLSEERAA